MKFRGPIFAIVTPFDSAGDIDFGAFEAYLGFLQRSGVENLIVNGTTGEFPSMAAGERKSVLEFCRLNFPGRLMVNISACSVKESSSFLEHASEVRADAALLLPPYYYSDATFDGLQAFFKAMVEKSNIPVFLYNFPKHTNVVITPGLLTAICEMNGPIQGIKDSSGNLDTALGFKLAVPRIQVFVGSDSLASSTLDKGLDGSVTGGGNPVPECLLRIADSFARGCRDDAVAWQSILDDWRSYRKSLNILEISAAKAGLAARIQGFPMHVRAPLSSPDRETASSVADHIERVVMPAIAAATAG